MSRHRGGFGMRRSERTSTTTIESGSDTTSASVLKEQLSSVDMALEAASKQYEPSNDRRFLNTYAHISTRKKARIKEIFDISISFDGKHATEEVPPESVSLVSWLQSLNTLLNKQSDSFVSCLFTAENSKSNAAPMWEVLKPLPAQVRLRNDVPRKALVYLLSQIRANSGQSLHLPDPVVREIAQAETPEYPIPRLKLPSQKSQDSQVTSAVEQEPLTWNLKWQSVTPAGDSLRYKNDLEAYIWQPFREPPSCTYVRIFILNKTAPRNIRAVFFFGSLESLETFRQERTACMDIFRDTEKVAFRLAHQIYAAYHLVLSDMMAFLQEMADEILAMTFTGRARPSKLKVQHLLHMNDCREKAIQDMTQNQSLLDECEHLLQSLLAPVESSALVVNPTPARNPAPDENSAEGESLKKIMQTLRSDLVYVLSELECMGPKILGLQREIESQNSLQSPNFALNTLAAIYVPLAFVTSFLGMNVTESPVKRWLNPKVSSDSQDAPTQRLWDMRWFAILSAPLLLGTILLPLVAGPVVRWMSQKSVKLGVFWRLIFASIGLIYPMLYYGLVYSSFDGSNFDGFFGSLLLKIVCDALLAAFALYQGYLAVHLEERGAVWTFTWGFVLTLACFLLDFLPDFHLFEAPFILYGAFGWFIIFLTRLYSYSRGWDAKRKARKDSETAEKEPVIRVGWL